MDINSLSFDSFARDATRDVVCLAPIRTIVRREEEIVLVRKVRKVEEIEAPLACPATSESLSSSSVTTQPATKPQPINEPVQQNPNPGTGVEPTWPAPPPEQPYPPVQPVWQEELIVDSRHNCYRIDSEAMTRLQEQTAVSRSLQPGTYTISLRSGTFDYQAASGHPGEPLVLLWLYGGRVINHQTNVAVGATWITLNGYGDTVTIDVLEPTSLSAFFFDTYLEDNEGEVRVTVEGAGYFDDLIVHSQRNCYHIDAASMKHLEDTAVSKALPIGSYAIQIKSGAFSYRSNSGYPGEPLVLLWIYGGKIINRFTNIEVGATWVSLNGYDDTLLLNVLEPATLCAFFFDTYMDDNEGEVRLSIRPV